MADEFEPDDVDLFEEELFRYVRVRELQDEDFLLSTAEKIVLRATGCSAVLFYVRNNATSRGLRDIWNVLSENFAGINFFAVNASLRVNIMRAFQQVNDDPDHPLSPYYIRGYPTILIYREGAVPGASWPKAFYNGDLSTDALQDWLLQLACVPGYTETPAIREGVVMDTEVIVTDDRSDFYSTGAASSLDYQSGDFRIDEATIDSNLDFQDEFEDGVYSRGESSGAFLNDMNTARPLPTKNIRNYRTTDYPGSLTGDDVGFLAEFADEDLGIKN